MRLDYFTLTRSVPCTLSPYIIPQLYTMSSVIAMGSKVEALKDGAWVPGTVLGVHQDAFDVLYEGGEGDMMKPSTEVRISASAEADVGISSAEKKKKKKSSSIGWNASAFADEEVVLEEDGGGEEVGVEAKKVSAPVVSVSVKKVRQKHRRSDEMR